MRVLNGLPRRNWLPPRGYLAVRGEERWTLRVRLCLIVAILMAPALILLVAVALRFIAGERAQVEDGLRRSVYQVSIEIDREIQGTTALLAALATSHALQSGDLERFHERTIEISRQLGVHILLRRPQFDNRTITTSTSWQDTPELTLTAVPAEAEAQALASDQTVISGVFFGVISKHLVVAAIMPVKRAGSSEYVLIISIPVSKIAGILENSPPGEGRLVSVIDRNNLIVARSENSERFAGLRGHSLFPKLLVGNEGTFDSISRDGVMLHSVYRRLPSTGWIVIAGERMDQIEASARRTIAVSAATGTMLLAGTIGLTFMLAGRMQERLGTPGIDRKPSREEFALLFDSAPNGVLLVDDQGVVLLANAQLERTFGYAPKELTGKPVETLIPETCRSAHVAHRKHFTQQPIARMMGDQMKLQGLHKAGWEFPIEVRLQPIVIQSQHYIIATVIDISDHTLAAAALARTETERDRLRRDLMRSSDEERLKLSHELHDQTGQTLTAAALAAKDIERYVGAEGRPRLEVLNALLDQMGETLHQVAWQLRPTSIDELGLRATLKTYVSDWSERTGIGADFYCEDENIDQLPDDVRTTVFRIVQESLTNVVKHAPQANWVSVVISRSDTLLRLTIEDNGNGFDVAEQQERLSQHRSLGIAGMRERLSLVGGTLDIESSPGNGTTLFARIPTEPAGLS